MTERPPTLVTYRSAEEMRDAGIRYAYRMAVVIGCGSIAALCALTGPLLMLSQLEHGWASILMAVAVLAAGAAFYGHETARAKYPRHPRLTLAELNAMSGMRLPPEVMEQTIDSVLIGTPEEFGALPASVNTEAGNVASPAEIVPLRPQSAGAADKPCATVEKSQYPVVDDAPVGENIATFRQEKRKTPEEFQAVYDTHFREHLHRFGSWLLLVPAVFTLGIGALILYYRPDIGLDVVYVAKTLVFYLVSVIVGWFAFIEPMRPRRDEGQVTRKILDRSKAWNK